MKTVKKILVGIDPRQLHGGAFSPPVAEAVKQATWLAESMSVQITFFSALDPPPGPDAMETLLPDLRHAAAELNAACQTSLDTLVEQARRRGIRAESKIVHGIGWVELAREAVDAEYDLVVVGTRGQGAIRRALFGSTAMKLLHNCPVPVWVTKPEPHPRPKKMLVASDFSEVSDKALRLAVSLGTSCEAIMHLIHVVREPFARLCDADEAEAIGENLLHEQELAAARRHLQEELERAIADVGPTTVTIADDTAVADFAIAKYVETRQIDLLVMGTTARHGLAGVFVGNTAERLLPEIDCSLLVVKPDGFECPVCLESQHADEPAA